MSRRLATLLAAGLALTGLETAACASARAAEPFEVVPMPATGRHPHLLAYSSLAAGAGLIGASFLFAQRADDAYGDYLVATDPDRIASRFDRTRMYDRLSSGSLLTGEALIATGLYLRFLRPAPTPRLSLELGPRTCALALRF